MEAGLSMDELLAGLKEQRERYYTKSMIRINNREIRVFFDSDVIFAGAASPNEYSASLVLLRMAEIT